MSPAPLLEARGLTRRFDVGSGLGFRTHPLLAVDDVSLALRPRTVTALVGESGSGKSTIARMLVRLYAPTSGTILLGTEDVSRIRGRRRLLRYRSDVQMVFQDPFGSLNPVKRVEHHVARALRIHKVVPEAQVHERVLDLLTTVGLVPAEEIAAKYPHELSGGQQQRVAIARALAVEPSVLIADEPVSMLDVSIRLGILNLILELKEQHDLALLYITHDLASARYVADEVLVLYAGQIVEQGPTDDVLGTPMHPYTRLLLSAVPNPEDRSRGRLPARPAGTNAGDPVTGCRFAARCPAVFGACSQPPELREVGPGHLARCHLYEPSTPA